MSIVFFEHLKGALTHSAMTERDNQNLFLSDNVPANVFYLQQLRAIPLPLAFMYGGMREINQVNNGVRIHKNVPGGNVVVADSCSMHCLYNSRQRGPV